MAVKTLFALFLCASVAAVFAQPLDPDRVNVMVEALSRLDPEQIRANPQLQAALDRVLEATRGTPRFVELVRKFQIQGHSAALLELAVKHSNDSGGIDALRLLFENQETNLIRQALQSTNTSVAPKLVEALGNLGSNQAVPWIESLAIDLHRDPALRKVAVLALAKTRAGADALLKLAKDDKLAADVKLAAGTALNQARWSDIKDQARQILPPPQGRNAQPLPPPSDLANRKGDSDRGAKVFASAEAACSTCHQVNGQGTDFGPKLSEIGTKLAKEALYESILDPSAGISFGYEAWQIQLKNGEEVFGLIVSETGDELAVKAQTSVVTRLTKSEISKRDRMTASIMPAGLQQNLSLQELVDLVEYLASLKKSEAQK